MRTPEQLKALAESVRNQLIKPVDEPAALLTDVVEALMECANRLPSEFIKGGGKRAMFGVHISASNHGNQNKAFVITMGRDILSQMGWRGGQDIHMQFGTPENPVVILRRTRQTQYTHKLQARHNTGRVVTGVYPHGVTIDVPHSATVTGYRIDGEALIIDLPEWFYGQKHGTDSTKSEVSSSVG